MGVAKSMTLRGGPTLSVTMTLIFPKIVWTCPLRTSQSLRSVKKFFLNNRECYSLFVLLSVLSECLFTSANRVFFFSYQEFCDS